MNLFNTFTRCTLTAAGLLAAAPFASAQSVDVDITGKISAGTCSIGSSAAIKLDDLSADVLDSSRGQVVMPKAHNLVFSSCIGVNSVDMTFTGTKHSDPDLYKNTAAGGPPVGVALIGPATDNKEWLKDGTTKRVSISGGTGSYQVRAGYYWASSFGTLTSGDVETKVTINLTYN